MPGTIVDFIKSFSGQGTTSRAGSLEGTIGVHVQKELPNGDLYVEGTKVVIARWK